MKLISCTQILVHVIPLIEDVLIRAGKADWQTFKLASFRRMSCILALNQIIHRKGRKNKVNMRHNTNSYMLRTFLGLIIA